MDAMIIAVGFPPWLWHSDLSFMQVRSVRSKEHDYKQTDILTAHTEVRMLVVAILRALHDASFH
jgi:hypothetical protein